MRFTTLPCILCGRSSTLELQWDDYYRWRSGEYVQEVWPDWSADQRELIMSGTHSECWDDMFLEEDV